MPEENQDDQIEEEMLRMTQEETEGGAQDGEGEGAGDGDDASAPADDGVVDAEFEEVSGDDTDKKAD